MLAAMSTSCAWSFDRSRASAQRIARPGLCPSSLVAPLLLCLACGGTAPSPHARDVRAASDEANGHPTDRIEAEHAAVAVEDFRAYALPSSYARLGNTRRLDAAGEHWQVGTYRVKLDEPLVVLPTFGSVPSEVSECGGRYFWLFDNGRAPEHPFGSAQTPLGEITTHWVHGTAPRVAAEAEFLWTIADGLVRTLPCAILGGSWRALSSPAADVAVIDAAFWSADRALFVLEDGRAFSGDPAANVWQAVDLGTAEAREVDRGRVAEASLLAVAVAQAPWRVAEDERVIRTEDGQRWALKPDGALRVLPMPPGRLGRLITGNDDAHPEEGARDVLVRFAEVVADHPFRERLDHAFGPHDLPVPRPLGSGWRLDGEHWVHSSGRRQPAPRGVDGACSDVSCECQFVSWPPNGWFVSCPSEAYRIEVSARGIATTPLRRPRPADPGLDNEPPLHSRDVHDLSADGRHLLVEARSCDA